MSEFCCKNGHIMGHRERLDNRCAECGEPIATMDGYSAKQLAAMDREDEDE